MTFEGKVHLTKSQVEKIVKEYIKTNSNQTVSKISFDVGVAYSRHGYPDVLDFNGIDVEVEWEI